MNARFLIPVFLLITTLLSGQGSMNEGFQLLESGSFEEAELFFDAYLESDPDNKTALICYGRAVGLSGEPGKAINLFSDLKKVYSDDFEVQINYNEAHLWDAQYASARPLYEALVNNNPDNFPALLGYANTLSNLKEYALALEWVNKALAVQPGNEGGKVSRKYIKLGYTNELVTKKQYARGEAMLNEILIDFPEDKETLLNLANLYLINRNVPMAKNAFQRIATTPNDSIRALNGIALADHIGEKDKEALKISRIALKKGVNLEDEALRDQTYERYVQALIWNSRYKEAKKAIDSLELNKPGALWIKTLRATLGMYTADFKSSLKEYDSILVQDSTSFDGNLGKANALFASDKITQAYSAAFKTLSFYEEQADAQGLVEKLNGLHNPSTEGKAFYTFDNGKNIAYGSQVSGEIPFSTKFRAAVTYQYRITENTITSKKALSHIVLAGATYKLLPKTNLKAVIGFNNASFDTSTYTQPILDLRLQLQPLRLQNAELGYQREVQNFNADLIEREIVMNHLGLNYNLNTTFKLGWYTQIMHTRQSDDNKRNLVFTSLYYNVFKKPAFKVGVNYQYMSFAEQVPDIYFSPEQYQAVEVFGDLRGSFSEKSTYLLNCATGLQKVEDDPQSVVFRLEAGLNQQISKRVIGSIYGKYSNIASATATGFNFTEIGVRLKWYFTKTPLFSNKMLAKL
ncbi:MAG: tetratricopeptide repeat protein [Eudoraea sp.]|nr:tetratricopeptide repeat protein [Eudoraea sp.]NNE03433.1 tetratricopeptide repeat protein [Eudoraea sp.]